MEDERHVERVGRFLGGSFSAHQIEKMRRFAEIGAAYLARGKSVQALEALTAFLEGEGYRAESDDAKGDRARLAALRGGQVDLTSHPGTTVHTPPVAGVHMGRLYAYRDKIPRIADSAVLFDSAEITGDVVGHRLSGRPSWWPACVAA